MNSEMIGNVLGTLVFLAFQICGLCISFSFNNDKPYVVRVLAGSVFGSVSLQWLPVLFAFAFGFNVLSHILSLLLLTALTVVVVIKNKFDFKTVMPKKFSFNIITILAILIYIIFAVLVIHSFRFENGAYHSSQNTYGDMSMHLGFITNIATASVFPPVYSIYPSTMLSYPFLCDSISSSIYIFGSSLMYAYFLPMLFAGAQVILGFYSFMTLWLKDKSKVFFALILFFFCGGFGFVYFMSGAIANPDNFTRIFTAFYETPTNLVTENIRFVNVIVDLLVPQRSTLFGWVVLFTALYFLLNAVMNNCKKDYIIVGILAGALPMIHTHSFLALAIVSAVWLLVSICKHASVWIRILLCFLPFGMSLVQIALGGEKEVDFLLFLCLGIVAIFLLLPVIYAIKQKADFKKLLPGWLIYLGITLALALPQLFFWTFSQATGSGFTRGYFNWGNIDDTYIWFYIVNLGVTALLFIPAVIYSRKKSLLIASPILIIMLISELIVFQPNTYDNNKLIYIAYLLLCGLISDFALDTYRAIKKVKGKEILAVCTVFLCVFSAVLTMGREFVATYEIYGATTVNFANYIEENTPTDSVFLTNERHLNEVSTLTGRNIVCGSSIYLYFHGLSYDQTALEAKEMYEYPQNSLALFEKNNVDYIVLGSYERSSYNVNESQLDAMFEVIYNADGIKLYQVN